jgi:hypothetical protein
VQDRAPVPARRRLDATADTARASFARLPLATRAVWLVAVCVLVAAPLALSLARSDRFEASLEAFPFQRPGYRPIGDPTGYVRRLLGDPLVADEAVRRSALPLDSSEALGSVRVEPTGRSVLVAAQADSPDHARDLADAVALAIVSAAARDIVGQARAQLEETRAELGSATGAERSRLERNLARLRREIEAPAAPIALGPRATTPETTRAVDRVIGWLPGPLPPRPSVVWTIVAGLMLATFVSLAAYVYTGSRRGPVPG